MTLPSFAFAIWKLMCNSIWPTPTWLSGAGRKWKAVHMDATRDERQELVRIVADRKLKVVVDSVWGFKNVLGGYHILWSGRAREQIIVKIDE